MNFRRIIALLFGLLLYDSLAIADPLHDAAKAGNLKEVQQLLAQGAYVNAQDGQANAPLHYAALHGHLAVVKALVAAGANVNARGYDDNTPVSRALEGSHKTIVDFLLSRGADRRGVATRKLAQAVLTENLTDVKKWLDWGADANGRESLIKTLLHFAAERGNREIVEILLTHKADPNIAAPTGETPLLAAVSLGRKDLAELLLAHGAKADIKSNGPRASTPLHAAIVGGNKDLVALLLAHKADANLKDAEGRTPLVHATVLKRSEIIELLVAHGATSDRDQLLGGVLLEAVQGGDVQKARELLAQGADSNFKDYSNEGQPLLHIAVTKGDRQMIEVLLAAGADVNGRDSVGQTALYGAVLYKSTDLAKLLLDHKADPNAHDSKGRSLLYLPIERDNPAMLKLLLAYGADPNREATFSGSMTEEQRNLLYWTLMSGHPETAEVLIAHGAKVNGNNNQLLNFAARKYHLYIARFLLAHGADPNAKGAEGWSSPLGSAVQSGYTEMAMLFLDHKADVNIRDSGGYTPLHWALYGGAEAAVEAVKFLLAHGADVNAKNLQNQTPLDLAMIGGSKSEVVNLLQAAGAKPDPQVRMRMDANLLNDALQSGNRQLVEQLLSQKTDVNACDGGRMTPLHQVADPTIAELLLAHGADVSARCPFTFTPFDEDSYLQTPLHFAALYGRDKVVEVFLQHKADVNVRVEVTENQHRIPPGPYAGSLGIFYRYENLQGATPLHFAAYMNNKDVIEVLLLHGAQVDITDSSGRTALHIAALEDGMVGAAEQLLAHKANVNAKDATGLTPLHVAAMRGHPAMVMVLLKHGANINAKDKAGNTAMRLAQRAGRVDMQPNQIAMLPPANASVVDILRRHGAKE